MSERRRLGAALAFALALMGYSPSMAQDAKPATVEPVGATTAGERITLRIGTNLVAGLYYPAGGALCRAAAKAGNFRCLVESTNGSTANIQGLEAGELEFGIVQSDWQYHAMQGSATFRESGPVKSLRAVMGLHAEPFTVVVRAAAGIDNFEQLKGKRIAAGPAESGQRILFDVLAAASGWHQQDLGTVVTAPADEAAQGFCAGEIDALILMANNPNAMVHRLLSTCDGRLLPVVGPAVAKVIADRRYYAPATIAGGLYGPDQPAVATLGVRATLVTSDQVPAEIVYALVRTVHQNFAAFSQQHPGLAGLQRDEMATAGLTAPLHEGALRYFREIGAIK